LRYYHHPTSLDHDPGVLSPDHPDTPERIEAIETAMTAAGWLGCERVSAPAATEAELELVHAAAHVEFIRDVCLEGGGRIDPDTFVGETSYQAALHAAGGACAMVRALVAGETGTAFCGLRPSGHHAEHDRAMGFCLFNNVAIATELAVRELGVRRVLVLDWDVHHGNGTAEFFRRRADVLFASIHQIGLFPGTGALADVGSGDGVGYTINVPVHKGSDEAVWLSVVEHVLVPIGLEFRPELILISAGFDAHRADPLGECRLEGSSFAHMACHVRDLAAELSAPVGAVLEGGYDLPALAECTLRTIAALGGAGEAGSVAPDPLVTPWVARHLGRYWTL
jgi:acetoin utilization deacetylase AcuC-like enzyme